MSIGEALVDGVWVPMESLPPERRSVTVDGDLSGRVGAVDNPRVHVRCRDGSALCGRVGPVWMTPSRHAPAVLCRWCARIMRGHASPVR